VIGQAYPRLIPARAGATSIASGSYHTCSIANGTVQCAGQNAAGELGDGTLLPQWTPVTSMSGVVALTLGDYTTCAIDGQQRLVCWGMNTDGQIDLTLRNKPTPTVIAGIDGVTSAAAGRDFTCAVLADKTARCWGKNTFGQLGNGATSPFAQPPVQVQIANLVEISAERFHACALDDAGVVRCFGEGYGASPVAISLPQRARAITSGAQHDCAITDDGGVYCWGNQEVGQLGNGSSGPGRTLTPQAVSLCQ
jgi:alpha-tubulin suppressor-like RCC1 family protein